MKSLKLYAQTGGGGSILTGIHTNLSPVFISGGEDDIELLVVQAKVGCVDIRKTAKLKKE